MTEFYMSLSPNDINAVRQEAYVLIPLRARDNQPAFWSWPHGYAQLPTGQFEFPVRLDDMGAIANSRIYFVPERSEFRLCSEQVYRLGPGAEVPFVRKPEHPGRTRPGDDRDLVQRVLAVEVWQHAPLPHPFRQPLQHLSAVVAAHQ